MAYLNEIDQTTAQDWLDNFDNVQNNIYDCFQQNTVLPKTVYDDLNNNNQYNIRIYFGLDSSSNPKVIALASYYLNPADYSEEGFTDLLVDGGIWELYSNTRISVETAIGYIDNWKANESDNLFKFGFLIPRPNCIALFENEELTNVRLFFGVDDNGDIQMMMQKPNGGSSDVIVDRCTPCPTQCSKDETLFE
jgi:hypothetical protein